MKISLPLLFTSALFPLTLLAQPSNDNCNQASVIQIANGGQNAGSFYSSISNLNQATIQPGETFSTAGTVAGLNQKSVWYKFSIPQARNVELSLFNADSIDQSGKIGYTVYRTGTCLPGDTQVSTKLAPLNNFGTSSHPNVDAGNYLVQVSGSSSAVGSIMLGLALQHTSPPPVVSFFAPGMASTGQEVTIRGANIQHATAVHFGNTPAASFSVGADTGYYIKAIVGTGSSGEVSVTNPAGTGSKPGFTYVSTAPTITGFYPTSGAPGTQVYIWGSRLNQVSSVLFGGVPANSFYVDMDTTFFIVATVGSAASGNITVSKASGTAVSSQYFTIIKPGNDTMNVCPNGTVGIESNITGTQYQWQVMTDSGFSNLSNAAPYSNVTSKTLQIANIPAYVNGKYYRCRVNNSQFSKTTKIQFLSVWTGTANSNFNNPNNWACGQLPDDNTQVIINQGNITVTANTTVRSIQLAPGANLQVGAGVTLTIKN